MLLILLIALGLAIHFYRKFNAEEKLSRNRGDEIGALNTRVASLTAEVNDLARFRTILDAEQKAREIIAEAEQALAQARADALDITKVATQDAKARREQAEARLAQAEQQLAQAYAEGERIIADARRRAEEIAGSAFAAKERAEEFEKAAKAMKNIIDGYGDRYVIPSYSLLDNLAEEYGYTEAGNDLKVARERTKNMVKLGQAATCDYVEENRRTTAIRFA